LIFNRPRDLEREYSHFINTIVIVVGGIAAIYFAQQQNNIFKEQNRIFAAQAGVKIPEPPPRNRFGLYWPALIAFLVALGVGIFIARLDLSAPKPVGAMMAAAPWTVAVMLVFSTAYLWKQSKGSEHDIKALQARIEQLRSESVSIAVNGTLVAGPALCQEQRTEMSHGLLNPLQIEALKIAKDLRDFLASLQPIPSDPTQTPGEENPQYLVRFYQARTEEQGKWRAKLMHGYANRKFGERITMLMHRAGEEVEYPAFVPSFAEKPPMSADDVRKLAQQMEMMAIWINRKERNEVDLLHPKP